MSENVHWYKQSKSFHFKIPLEFSPAKEWNCKLREIKKSNSRAASVSRENSRMRRNKIVMSENWRIRQRKSWRMGLRAFMHCLGWTSRKWIWWAYWEGTTALAVSSLRVDPRRLQGRWILATVPNILLRNELIRIYEKLCIDQNRNRSSLSIKILSSINRRRM